MGTGVGIPGGRNRICKGLAQPGSLGELVRGLLELDHKGREGKGDGGGSSLPDGQGPAPRFWKEPHTPSQELTT